MDRTETANVQTIGAEEITLDVLAASDLILPTFAGENLPRLYRLAGWRAGIWVRRDSWGNTVAFLRSVAGQSEGKLSGRDPYYSSPEARADIYDWRSGELLDEDAVLPCVGCWQWSWIGVPQELWDLGVDGAFERTLSARAKTDLAKRAHKLEEAVGALNASVTLTRDTYPVKEQLKALGFLFRKGGWRVPVDRLEEALTVVGSERARQEAQAQLETGTEAAEES